MSSSATFQAEKNPTHRDSGQEPLRHVGDDDPDEEDDGLEPVVAEDERYDKERDAKEDGHSRDEVDEVCYLTRDGRLSHLEPRGEVGDATHHRAVARLDDESRRSAWK